MSKLIIEQSINMIEYRGLNVLIVVVGCHLLLLAKSYAAENICTDEDYRDITLKLLKERTVADPFIDYTK